MYTDLEQEDGMKDYLLLSVLWLHTSDIDINIRIVDVSVCCNLMKCQIFWG